MPSQRGQIPSFEESNPSFLEMLRSEDPAVLNMGWEQFYRFTVLLLLGRRPSSLLRRLALTARATENELCQDFVEYMSRDQFRRVLTYQDRGQPFACWLRVCAHHYFLNELGKAKKHEQILVSTDEESRPAELAQQADPGPNALDQLIEQEGMSANERRRAVKAVLMRRAVRQLTAEQLNLLMLRATLMPREIVQELGLEEGENKAISDKIRYLRRRLRNLFDREAQKAGYRWDRVERCCVRDQTRGSSLPASS